MIEKWWIGWVVLLLFIMIVVLAVDCWKSCFNCCAVGVRKSCYLIGIPIIGVLSIFIHYLWTYKKRCK